MKKIVIWIFFLKVFLFEYFTFAQKTQSYNLILSNTEAFFFNAIIHNNKVHFGTDHGVIVFQDTSPQIIKEAIFGPIGILGGEIIQGQILYDDFYNYLLPTEYFGFNTFHLIHKDYLYIICKGDLFVFRKASFTFKNYPSIRSISENYIGTYGGIFDKNKNILDFPSYTGNKIIEYDSITIINWDGLSIINNDIQEDFYNINVNVGGIEINNQFFGSAIDSYEIGHPNYLLSTTKGLYNFNVRSKEIRQVFALKNKPFRFIRGEKNSTGLKIIYLFNEEEIVEYYVEENKIISIVSKPKIKDVFSQTSSEYYILTDNTLEFYSIKESDKNRVITKDLINTNNVLLFKNFILITSDQGLDLIDLNSNEIANKVIKDELNYNAIYRNDSTIKLGGVNGLYELNYNDLTTLFTSTKKSIEKESNKLWYFLLGIIVVVTASLSILIITVINQNKIIQNQRNLEFIDKKSIIEDFIKKNISTVNIRVLSETFNLPINSLYVILGNKKPGEIIRKERLRLVKIMRRKKATEEEIAKATGFSISYLKKI